jgi:hypothetical protein
MLVLDQLAVVKSFEFLSTLFGAYVRLPVLSNTIACEPRENDTQDGSDVSTVKSAKNAAASAVPPSNAWRSSPTLTCEPPGLRWSAIT